MVTKFRNQLFSIFSPKFGSLEMSHQKCNCCETALSNLDKDKSSFIPKYCKCAHCRQPVCRYCRENSRCHECNMRLTVIRNPDELMKLDKPTLLGYLKTLHYEEHIFDNWEKPYLVKQLLTRFQVHQDWDPSRYNAVAQWALSSNPKPKRKPDRHRRRTEVVPRDSGPWQATPDRNRRQTEVVSRQSSQATGSQRFEQVGDHIYSLPTTGQDRNVAVRQHQKPPIPRQTHSMRKVPFESIQDIPSATYFEGMDADELKSILKKSIDSNSIMGQDELKFILQILWTNMKKEKSETSSTTNRNRTARDEQPLRPSQSEAHLGRAGSRSDQEDGTVPELFQYSQEHRYQSRTSRRSAGGAVEGHQAIMHQLSASTGTLNLMDEIPHLGAQLPPSTSCREIPSRTAAPVKPGRRVKDMKALFERQTVLE